ncbi:MAG: hypothetical protein KC422_01540 [Trueperaceae bacterium]|nr:hypothetical protein [Trueperaceae bacterium]
MITLKNKDTSETIGEITEAQLQFLRDQLEEESLEDNNYWLNRAMLEVLREQGADAELLKLLESAMASKDDIEIEW